MLGVDPHVGSHPTSERATEPDETSPGASALTSAGPTHGAGRRHLLAAGAAAIAIGATLIAVATLGMTSTSSLPRVLVGVVGLLLLQPGISRLGRYLRGDSFDVTLCLATGWLGILIAAAVFADLLPLSEARDASKALRTPPQLRPDLFSAHPLGTDSQGLDILGGLIYGARVSLIVSFGAVVIGALIGGLIGILAGYFRGRWEQVVNVLTDATLAFPPLILLLGMAAVLEPSIPTVTVALGLLGIPTYIRLSRASTLVAAQRDFVLASRILGARTGRVIGRELLPTVGLAVVSYGFVVLGAMIVAEASLSFLGLSIQRPNPTWGNMIAAGQSNLGRHPHTVFAPGAVLFATIYSLNRIGDRARRIWDPRESRL